MAIFPKEIIESTSEYYLAKIKVSSRAIYALLTLTLIGGLFALPFVAVDLSIKGRGILAPKSSRVAIYAPVTGPVIYSSIYENASLIKGDTICIVNTELLDSQIEFNKKYKKETNLYLSDLKKISKTDFVNLRKVPELRTEVYRSSVSELTQRLKQINNQIAKTKIDYLRDKKLFNSEVISSKEYEKTFYEFELAKSNYELAKQEKLAQWELDEHKYKNEIEQTSAKIEQLLKERERYFLIAPISGVVQQYNGIREGSFVYANQKIIEISSDSSLIAEMYIAPSDIGFINVGKPVKLQIDAFNYNQWGMINGEIIEVADDIVMINETPVFKVKCAFKESYLTLKNGYKGKLKKGMTVGGRIMISKRSLYQLLYDKADDWLNPSKA